MHLSGEFDDVVDGDDDDDDDGEWSEERVGRACFCAFDRRT